MKIARKLEDLDYDLELERIVKTIIKEKAKRVLLQFPDGLKPWATCIADEIRKKLGDKSKTEVFIWFNSCFGACDVPLEAASLKVDLIIQFGHSEWNFREDQKKEIKVLK